MKEENEENIVIFTIETLFLKYQTNSSKGTQKNEIMY